MTTTDSTTESTWETVIGLEVHVELATDDEALLRVPERVRRRAEHERVPGVPRPARLAAGPQREGRSSTRCASREALALRRAGALDLRTGRTTSIRTCRRTTRSASTTSRSASTARSRSTAHAIGIERAHLEEDTGKTLHIGGGGRIHEADVLARRLQPRRRTADGDREPARHPLGGAGARVRRRSCAACSQAIGVSDVKMEEGSMRVDANVSVRPRGHDRARHQGRDQEHELAALARAGDRVRDRAPDRAARRRASASCRRPATGTRTRATPTSMRTQGGGRTTTATSPSPTCAARAERRACGRVRVEAMPELPAATRARLVRSGGSQSTTRATIVDARPRGVHDDGDRRRDGGRGARRRQLGARRGAGGRERRR